MKITQEVRDFAAKQEAGLLNTQPFVPSEVEGRSAEEAEAGMAEMSERYRDGGDLYVPAE
jgi:phosphomethylpyrimidine synthase